MIFSQAGDIVKNSYLMALQEDNQERKSNSAKAIDFYNNYQVDYITKQLAQYITKIDSLRPCFINIVKKVIDQLAMVYIQDAIRDLNNSTEKDKALFANIEKEIGLGAKLKQANRLSKLCGVVLLRPVYRNGAMDIDLLTPDILDVEIGDTPEQLTSVMITHYPDNGRNNEITFSLWTKETIKTLNYRGFIISEQDNPYNILPFCPIWAHLPSDVFWINGAQDLITIQEALNEKLTDLLYIVRMQGFGVGYVKGMKGEIDIVDPGVFFNLPTDGELGFAKTNAPISDTLNVLEFLLKQAAVSNGLPATSLTTEPQEESGTARLAANRELEEKRRDDIALFRKYERNLFNLIKIVWNYHNPAQVFSDKCELIVDFYDPKPSIDPDKQVTMWKGLLELGVMSQVDIMLERNPDLTREDAKIRLIEIQDEISEFTRNSL